MEVPEAALEVVVWAAARPTEARTRAAEKRMITTAMVNYNLCLEAVEDMNTEGPCWDSKELRLDRRLKK